ncbi:MAG: VOC family protein [Acidobacteriota bacterium]|jgi:catechol 2,3-dioxygenase-like lactoylglutathione lyase family enzyme|nr:VOC family protein [Acidobacteriota bacterium]
MIKGIALTNITIDCKDAKKLRKFYASLLGWEEAEMFGMPVAKAPTGFTLLFAPEDGMSYERPVWPEQPGKQQKQTHLDFTVDDVKSAVAEAEALGAVKASDQFGGDHFTTMFDPDGHPFCLCAKG